jgi:hypothetical protein
VHGEEKATWRLPAYQQEDVILEDTRRVLEFALYAAPLALIIVTVLEHVFQINEPSQNYKDGKWKYTEFC